MSKLEKLVNRLTSQPKDFSWDELVSLLNQLNFKKMEGSGSRVKFFNTEKNCLFQLHKPHSGKILKHYMIKEIWQRLTNEELI
jgi:hypothetical protein